MDVVSTLTRLHLPSKHARLRRVAEHRCHLHERTPVGSATDALAADRLPGAAVIIQAVVGRGSHLRFQSRQRDRVGKQAGWPKLGWPGREALARASQPQPAPQGRYAHAEARSHHCLRLARGDDGCHRALAQI